MVMCYLNETHPTAPHKYNMGFEHDPRIILSKVLAEAMQHRLNFLVGFELEFILLEQSMEAHAPGASFGTLAIHITQQIPTTARRISNSNPKRRHRRMQIPCRIWAYSIRDRYRAFATHGAIDPLIYSQEAIRSTAFKYGIYATFHPNHYSTVNREMASTCISQWNPPTKNSSDKFFAGLLKHLQAMCLFIMLNNDSYERAGDFFSDKAAPVCWATENKTTPLRQIRPGILGITQDRRVRKSISLSSCAHRGWNVGIGIR
jgi:glutamine synthetase